MPINGWMILRLIGFAALLATLGASGYSFTERWRAGELNPVEQIDAAATRGELASAQYVLGIVAAQLEQVRVISGSYGGTLQFDAFPLVTLVRADERSYCLEFRKTHTFFLAGPGGTTAQGTC